MLGGADKDHHVQLSTQIVRPSQPTAWGPDMTEVAMGQCSSTLADNSVMVTGGRTRSDLHGSARSEVYNFTTQQWSKREDMNQSRFYHSCSTVWLDSSPDSITGIIPQIVTNRSVLSMVVAGGEPL